MALEPGTRLGPYEILSLLGRGGMGEVYRARDTRLERDVAIKVLPPEVAGDEDHRQRLEREAKTLSQLHHPHICTLYDIGSEEVAPFFLVMEHLEGETLEDRLRRGPLPLAEALRIGREIAEALEAAHRRGVVHRDLKPGNVMLTEHGARVLDFGLAKGFARALADTTPHAPTLTRQDIGPAAIAGTIPYMAPEQLEGRPADARTDLWALGCVLYEMVTGDRPFHGETEASLIGSIMSASPEPVSRLQPVSPERLEWLVGRCLERDPERRLQSARDVSIELEAIAEAATPSVTAVSPADVDDAQEARPPTGRARIALPLAGLLILILGIGGWWLNSWRGAEDQYAILDRLNGTGPFRALAVRPFENFTGNAQWDQMAQGVAEAVLGRLTGYMRPVSRNTSFALAEVPVCEAAEAMEVEFVLDGSIQKTAEQLRITAQLVLCPAENPIWTQNYDYDVSDAFEIQDDVSALIVGTLQQVLLREDLSLAGSPTWHLLQQTRSDNERALELLEEGARREPADARWIEWIIHVHMQRLREGWTVSEDQTRARIEELIQECHSTDAQELGCYQASGTYYRIQGDTTRSLAARRRQIELSHGSAAFRAQLAGDLARAGHAEEALSEVDVAMRSSPNDIIMWEFHRYRALALYAAGRYNEAAESLVSSIAIRPNDLSYVMLAAVHVQRGSFIEASEALAEARKLRPDLSLTSLRNLGWWNAADPELREQYFGDLRRAGLGDERFRSSDG